MQAPRTRALLFALLLVIGAGAGFLAWSAEQHAAELQRNERNVATRLDSIVETLGRLGTAQHAYVAPGQPDGPWLEQFSSLLPSLTANIEALRPLLPSQETATALQQVAEGAASLAAMDQRAREQLSAGQDLLAADLIFSESLHTLDAISASLVTLRQAERTAFDSAHAGALRQASMVLGFAALVWVLGLVALLRAPGSQAVPVIHASPSPEAPPAARPVIEELPSPAAGSIDLAAAADVCTELSRLTSTVALPDLLARAAVVLNASGIIVWMGAGEELFAVTAHGYDPRVISRLGSISRNADNATAACWRTGELNAVTGDALSNGAIVAPMFGPDSCVGVLAVEVRRGLETDGAARAVTTMIAAQLATVLATWPAASTPAESPTAASGL